ncbi:filamin-A-interacting protein 1-like [Gadus chalcogrammus]|uniref:filamin-A-interacting protein 1-like n=1 Tax=Gadus chalcogrammus TaxID=1042646 RepID=UPI0024C4DDF4|nr:filamin-A-interacting protein 1-like [Gadus chalcogrammus]
MGRRAEDFYSTTTVIPTPGLQRPRITIVPRPPSGPPGPRAAGDLSCKSPVTITTVSRASSPDRSPGARSPVSVLSVSRKSNITTTEDNRIHIHLGPAGPRPGEGPGGAGLSVRTLGVAEGRETSTGTVLRSPRQAGATATGKMTSSITITPITSATCRPTQPPAGATSRIPMSRGLKTSAKAGAAVATVTRMESRSEGQLMKIELRRSAGCGPASSSGGKS